MLLPYEKIECGCYAERDGGEYVIAAEAFICPDKHKQGTRIPILGVDGEPLPFIHPGQETLA